MGMLGMKQLLVVLAFMLVGITTAYSASAQENVGQYYVNECKAGMVNSTVKDDAAFIARYCDCISKNMLQGLSSADIAVFDRSINNPSGNVLTREFLDNEDRIFAEVQKSCASSAKSVPQTNASKTKKAAIDSQLIVFIAFVGIALVLIGINNSLLKLCRHTVYIRVHKEWIDMYLDKFQYVKTNKEKIEEKIKKDCREKISWITPIGLLLMIGVIVLISVAFTSLLLKEVFAIRSNSTILTLGSIAGFALAIIYLYLWPKKRAKEVSRVYALCPSCGCPHAFGVAERYTDNRGDKYTVYACKSCEYSRETVYTIEDQIRDEQRRLEEERIRREEEKMRREDEMMRRREKLMEKEEELMQRRLDRFK